MHAEHATDIQEFLIIPVGAKTVIEAVEANSEVHKKTKEAIFKEQRATLGKGDEGAWAPNIRDEEALDILSRVCRAVEEDAGIKIRMGIDVAASTLWDPKKERYVYKKEGKERSREKQIEYICNLIEKYNLYYVEDPVEEEDFAGFVELTKRNKCLICGDDLYATNVERIKRGIRKKASNTVLIKPNQCGTLTDTYKAINIAKTNNFVTVLSHRSGETIDETIAHLAVAFGSPIIKCGIVGGERTAKLNELIRISEELTSQRAKMALLPM